MTDHGAAGGKPVMEPMDEHNRELVANVHPHDWTNPQATERYHLVVVGAGTAGLAAPSIAAGLGARVALIERHLMGGDCLNVGCVPSKGVIEAARALAGCRPGRRAVRWPGERRQRQLRRRDGTYPPPAGRNQQGRRRRALPRPRRRRLPGRGTIRRQRRRRGRLPAAALPAGGDRHRSTRRRAADPRPRPDRVSDQRDDLLPHRVAAPARGHRRGTDRLRDGPVVCSFRQRGPPLRHRRPGTGAGRRRRRRGGPGGDGEGRRRASPRGPDRRHPRGDGRGHRRQGDRRRGSGGRYESVFDEILVAVGRKPNVEGLGLEAAGVEYDRGGVEIDDRLRTTNSRIFAVGDIASPYKFTHTADFQVRMVIRNAFFFGRQRASRMVVPWTTYTSPEIAHVGLYRAEAEKLGFQVDTVTVPLADVDRARLDGEEEGFLRIHLKKGSDRILGGTMVAAHAGDMIGLLSLAITQVVGLGKFSQTIFPYPTQGEVFRKAGDVWSRTRLTAGAKRFFELWFKLFS